jgi:ribosomal 30S subunit maturation factor RimM
LTLVTAGRVGKPHGYDGRFYVEGASHPLALGEVVIVGSRSRVVARRAGTAERPLIRLEGVDDARSLRGKALLVEAELADDEWLAGDLVGRSVAGHGRVARVLDGPSCSVLELTDGTLVPFVRDAISSVGADAIEINEDFLG